MNKSDLRRRASFRVPFVPSTLPIDWWFGWHSDEPQRYKLWHPRAHVHAQWGAEGTKDAPDRPDLADLAASGNLRGRHIGRVSSLMSTWAAS
jgi:hypothetical protein